ncbi:MAG: hypothetical protein K0S07_359 [Chlamydiales bacterium]|jgi:hypothetical protein|nr:hypothetical protein [Chlamydiales bacterium]
MDSISVHKRSFFEPASAPIEQTSLTVQADITTGEISKSKRSRIQAIIKHPRTCLKEMAQKNKAPLFAEKAPSLVKSHLEKSGQKSHNLRQVFQIPQEKLEKPLTLRELTESSKEHAFPVLQPKSPQELSKRDSASSLNSYSSSLSTSSSFLQYSSPPSPFDSSELNLNWPNRSESDWGSRANLNRGEVNSAYQEGEFFQPELDDSEVENLAQRPIQEPLFQNRELLDEFTKKVSSLISENGKSSASQETKALASNHSFSYIGHGFYKDIYKTWSEAIGENAKEVVVATLKQPDTPQAIQEIQTARRLFSDHFKGMPRIHGVLETSSQSFIVSKYCNRGALSDHVHKQAPSYAEKVELAIKAFAAVSRMHEKGFVHHDISLENFLAHQSKGEVKVYINDFGFLTKAESQEARPEVINLFLAAPEIIRGGVKQWNDPKYDSYQLGCALYILIGDKKNKDFPWYKTYTQAPSHQAPQAEKSKWQKQVMKKKGDLDKMNFDGFSKEMVQIIKGCMDPNPHNRLSASEALDLLKKIEV